jgi:hypothetical protein
MFDDKTKAQLEAELPNGSIESRKLGSSTVDYIPAHLVIDGLNRIFGYGRWCTDVIEHRVVTEGTYTQRNGREGYQATWYALVRLTVHGVATYTDTGLATATNPGAGDAHEQAAKSAISDGLKRCARHLGRQFGLSLYGDLPPSDFMAAPMPEPEAKPEPPPAEKTDRRAEARAALIEVVKASGVEPKRVFKAIMAKLGKPANAITADEFAHMGERIKAMSNVDGWCAHCLGETNDPDPNWAKANKALHAEFATYCRATGTEGDSKDQALAIVHDVVRARCGLPVSADWPEVTVDAMDFVRGHLKQTEVAQVALNTEWATIAAERRA